MRDDFSENTKGLLAKRVGYRCSNPNCRKSTSGPQIDINKSINIGVAAHISAASPGGKRYNNALSSQERQNIKNGIWLCQTCGKLIDSDDQRYTIQLLNSWKTLSEAAALLDLENNTNEREIDSTVIVSINQSGGQTAKTIINNKPVKRSFLPHKQSITKYLKSKNAIPYHINVLMADPETVNLGNELKQIFHDAGWKDGDVVQGLGGSHPPGIIISKDKDSEQFDVVAWAIYQTGLKEVAAWPEYRGDRIQIYIGPNPD